MKKTIMTALAYTVGLLLIVTPVVFAAELAERLGVMFSSRKALLVADEVMRRTEETARQVHSVLTTLAAGQPSRACSVDEIALMRKLAVSASYLQGVGRVEANRLTCSSLGSPGAGVGLGAPDYISDRGIAIRAAATLPIAPQSRFIILEHGGFATIVHRDLIFDVSENTSGIALAVVSTSTQRIVASRGGYSITHWPRSIGKGDGVVLDTGDAIVAMRRSTTYDLTSVVAIPAESVAMVSRELKTYLVPIGVLAGLALASAFAYFAHRQVSVPALLRGALRRDEFSVAYQPVVRLDTRQCVGAEALLRWRRADGTQIRPDLFIPIAEETGIITSITRRMLSLVERDLPGMVAAFPQFHIGVNLSPRDLDSADIVRQLADLMRRSGICPGNLIVEATERGLIDVALATTVIQEMRAAGIGVAIDDFGTGYSCLSYLTTLNVDFLKIDKSFVDTIGTSAPTNSVVPHIIEMAKSLNLVMIAEGVETETQAEFLRDRGVQFAQGWLFAKPMAAGDLMRYVAASTAGKQGTPVGCDMAVA